MDQNTYNILSLIAIWVQCLGIAIAAIVVIMTVKQSRRERKLAVYESSNSPIVEWLAACREYPDLDVFFVPISSKQTKKNKDTRIELMIFMQFLLVLERVCVVQVGAPSAFGDLRTEQWEIFLRPFMKRNNFVNAYKTFKPFLHDDLTIFIDSLFLKLDINMGSEQESEQ